MGGGWDPFPPPTQVIERLFSRSNHFCLKQNRWLKIFILRCRPPPSITTLPRGHHKVVTKQLLRCLGIQRRAHVTRFLHCSFFTYTHTYTHKPFEWSCSLLGLVTCPNRLLGEEGTNLRDKDCIFDTMKKKTYLHTLSFYTYSFVLNAFHKPFTQYKLILGGKSKKKNH